MASEAIKLLHLSDTHNLQDHLEPLLAADVLIHTGDLTNKGTRQELEAVNVFFGTIKDRYKHILVVLGNADVHGEEELDHSSILTNVTLLNHEVAEGVESEYGLKIFGSPFLRSQLPGDPAVDKTTNERSGHLFDLIPENMDILLTHGPPRDILDVGRFCYEEDSGGRKQLKLEQWGSCFEMNEAIMRARPRAHLFGHVHEQRGYWLRGADGSWHGRVESQTLTQEGKAEAFPTKGKPPSDWPCHFISSNAMKNEDHQANNLAGRPRLIFGCRGTDKLWHFGLE